MQVQELIVASAAAQGRTFASSPIEGKSSSLDVQERIVASAEENGNSASSSIKGTSTSSNVQERLVAATVEKDPKLKNKPRRRDSSAPHVQGGSRASTYEEINIRGVIRTKRPTLSDLEGRNGASTPEGSRGSGNKRINSVSRGVGRGGRSRLVGDEKETVSESKFNFARQAHLIFLDSSCRISAYKYF